ncbi:GLUG motif-containing protein, partial [Psychroflexus planctonicus]|uniref:GLUG motif-containing protein n=1 Tax=Psychroflexus planctonicus TaxID=1526575 RepID=UPI001E50207D
MKLKLFLLITLFSVVNLTAQVTAVQPFGSGTEIDPYQITSFENLFWISDLAASASDIQDRNAAHYIQLNDIDASESQTIANGFNPIGKFSDGGFSGSYNGQGFAIDSLSIDRDANNTAFIGLIDSGSVENLNFTNAVVESNSNNIAVLAASLTNSGSIISSSVSSSTITVTGTSIGNIAALVGTIDNATISDSYVEGTTVTATGANRVGGLVGRMINNASITTSYVVNTDITGNSDVGGFVGLVSGGEINNSYARGNVNGVTNTGGFAGSITGGLIDKSYAANTVTASDTNEDPAGFANQTGTNLVTNSFYDSDVTSTDNSDATGETTANMTQESIFITAGWDFVCETTNGTEDIWSISTGVNNTYPNLNGEEDLFIKAVQPQGDGSTLNPYLITSLANLYWITITPSSWDANFEQIND